MDADLGVLNKAYTLVKNLSWPLYDVLYEFASNRQDLAHLLTAVSYTHLTLPTILLV